LHGGEQGGRKDRRTDLTTWQTRSFDYFHGQDKIQPAERLK
jgi:hypothetical protein